MFLTFWLRNVLRKTVACNFSFLISPDGSSPAALASLLFDPPEPQSIGKHSVSRLFYPFAPLHLLSSDSLSSLIFLLLPFSSDSSHLWSAHIVGSSQPRICWVSISGAGEWWQENARPEKPEQSWNLAGPFLRNLAGTMLQPCWNSVEPYLGGTLLEPWWCLVKTSLETCWNCWSSAGTWWNLAGTLRKPCCWNRWLEHLLVNHCVCGHRFSCFA